MPSSSSTYTPSWLGSTAPSDGMFVGLSGQPEAVNELLALNPPPDTLVDMLVGAMRAVNRNAVIADIVAHIRKVGAERSVLESLVLRDEDAALRVLLQGSSAVRTGLYETATTNGCFRCALALQSNVVDSGPIPGLVSLRAGIAAVGDVRDLKPETRAAIEAVARSVMSCDLPSTREALIATEDLAVRALECRAEFVLEIMRELGYTLRPHLLWQTVNSSGVSPVLAMPLAKYFWMAGTIRLAITHGLSYQTVEELVQWGYDASEIYQGLDALSCLPPHDVSTLLVLLRAGADPMLNIDGQPSFARRVAELHAEWLGDSGHISLSTIAGAVSSLVAFGFPYYAELSVVLGREVRSHEEIAAEQPIYAWLQVHATIETIRNLDGPAPRSLVRAAEVLAAHFRLLSDHSEHAASICGDLEAFLAQHRSADSPDSRNRLRP